MKNRLQPRLYWLILTALFLLLSFGMALPVRAAAFVVDTTSMGDVGDCSDGFAVDCSLEDAIDAANVSPGLDTITFDPALGGPITLTLTTALTIGEAVEIDGVTGLGGNCPADASDPLPMVEIQDGGVANAFIVMNGDTTLRGLVLNGFNTPGDSAILLQSDNNTVECSFIGTDINGTSATGANFVGIEINTANGNLIRNNTIVSNSIGIAITNSSTTTVRDNRIGTSVDGSIDLGPFGSTGVIVTGGGANAIGVVGGGNTISGNDNAGIQLITGTAGNTIEANHIGTDITGTSAIPNTTGVIINGGSNNNIIGGAGAAGNVISGNSIGVLIQDNTTSNNTVAGNYIGLEDGGFAGLPNTSHGIDIDDALTNIIGGGAGSGNFIGSNGGAGIRVSALSTGNTISFNFIGTNFDGDDFRPNATGILLDGGGNTLTDNLISGNTGAGVSVNNASNTFQNNIIGLDIASGALPNANGIVVNGSNNTIDNGNTIAGNTTSGVVVQSGTGNRIQANNIFGHGSLGIDLQGGGNAGQPAPTLFHVTDSLNATPSNPNINYDLTGFAASTSYTINFYANTTADCEGEVALVGTDTVTTDGAGSVINQNFTGIDPVAIGSRFISATATGDVSGNTSEFSACEQEQDAPSFQLNSNEVDPATLPDGFLTIPYNETLTLVAPAANLPTTIVLRTLPGEGLPPGITATLNAGSVDLTGTPTVAGPYTFTFRASDAKRFYGDQTFTINISATLPLVLSPAGNPAVLPPGEEGVAYSQTITSTGTAPITFTLDSGTLPPGLSLSAGGVLSGNPTTAGVYTFTIRANDSASATGTEDYSLTIYEPLVLTPPSGALPSVGEGATYNEVITVSGGDTTYETMTVNQGTLPPTGLVVNIVGSTFVVSGTPNQTSASVTPYTFTVTVNDSTVTPLTNIAYSITITEILVTPAALPDGNQGQAYSQVIGTTGGVGPFTYTISAGTQPTGLNLTGTPGATDTLSGTPSATGAFNFTIRATDSTGAFGETTYDVDIFAPLVLTPPTGALPSVGEGATYNEVITVSGGDTTYETITVDQGTLPPTGLVVNIVGSTFVVSGTPNQTSASVTPYTFTVTVSDSITTLTNVAYSITITEILVTPAAPAPGLPDGIQGQAYSQVISASGGVGPYTFTISAGTQPTGLNLTGTPGATDTLSGTPSAIGSFNFTIRATDSTGAFGETTYDVDITALAPLALNPPSGALPSVGEGASYNQVIMVTGGDLTYEIMTVNQAGLTGSGLSVAVVGNTFEITGTPSQTAAAGSPYGFTVTVSDSITTLTDVPYSIPVTEILVTPAALPDGLQGVAYSQVIGTTGGVGPFTYTVSAGALPGGLSLTGTPGVTDILSGTPSAAGVGFNFTIRATDSTGAFGETAYTIDIGAPITLVSVPDPLENRANGVAYPATTFTAAGGTGTLTVTEVGAVLGGHSLSLAGTNPVTLSGTTSNPGVVNFTLRVTDSGTLATADFNYSFEIEDVNLTPAAGALPGAVEGVNYNPTSTPTITINGGDDTYETITVDDSALIPIGLSVNIVGNTLVVSGIPAPGSSAGSPYSFTVTIDDSSGGTIGPVTYTIAVSTVVLAFVPPDLPNTIENIPAGYTQNIQLTNGTAPYDVCISGGTLPAAGLTTSPVISTNCAAPTNLGPGVDTFQVIGAGAGNAPNANGTANFTFTATDSLSVTGTEAYTVVVAPQPVLSLTSSPDPLPDGALVPYNATFTPATTGAGPLTVSLLPGGTLLGLTFTPGATGTLSGTPTAGTANFTLEVRDSNNFTATFPYTFVIAPMAMNPASPLPGGATGAAYSQVVSVTGGDGDYTLSASAITPAGSNLTITTGTPTAADFTISAATLGAAGTYTFTLSADDGNGGIIGPVTYSVTITGVTITVNATVNGTPVTSLSGVVGSQIPVQFTGTGGVGAHTVTSIVITPALSGMAGGAFPSGGLPATTGTLTGAPDPGTAGSYTVDVTATDSLGNTGTTSFPLTISNGGFITITPTTITGTVGIALTPVNLVAANGTGPYTFSLFSGSLPPGLSLSAAGVISGTPTVPFTGSFTVRAIDANGLSGNTVINATMSVPVIGATPPTIPNGSVSAPYSVQLTGTGGPPLSTYTFAFLGGPADGVMPPGLSISSAGLISGTPTTAGDYTFVITVTNSAGGSGTVTYTVTITTLPAITLGPSSLPNGTQGIPYSQTLTVNPSAPPFTFTIASGALPTGLILNGTTGEISGTPSVALGFNFTINVVDSLGRTDSQVYNMSIIGANAPVYVSDPAPGAQISFGIVPAGTSVQRTIIISEGGGSALVVTAPPGSPFAGANPGSFAIIGGNPPFTIPDGGASVTLTISCSPQSSLGASVATLTLTTNDPLRPLVTYLLRCNDVTAPVGTPTPGDAVPPTGIAPGVSVITVLTGQPDGVPPTGEIGRVVGVRGLALRSGPYLGATMLGIIRPNKDYVVLARHKGDGGNVFSWFLVVDIDNDRVGWASGRYMTVTGENNIPFQQTIFDQIDGSRDVGVRVITYGNVNIRPRPSIRSIPMAVTPYGTQLAVLGRTMQAGEMQWLHIRYTDEAGNVMFGWIYWAFDSPDLVKATGIAPLDAVPIR